MKLIISILFTLTILFSYGQTPQTPQAPQGSIVAQHGLLQVSGKYVANQYNQKISLAGNSLFWSNAKWDGAPFYNAETVNHLVDDWNTSIIRIAMGVKEPWEQNIGYLIDPETELNKVKTIVDAAIAKGVYVIVDWHSHYAHLEQSEAIGFFEEIATLYGEYDNLIYEIFNEPKHKWVTTTWQEEIEANELTWPEIKTYAEAVINAIRNIDPDNLIVVGTPHWSGGHLVGKPNRHHSTGPADDPITIDDNIAYTLHFYAADDYHNNNFKQDTEAAMDKGIAIFATEWGTIGVNGDGEVNYYQTDEWMKFLKENYISHANWAVGDKDEGHAIVNAGAGVDGLLNNQLSESGRKVKDIIKNWNVPPVNLGQNPPNGNTSKYEAENASLIGVNTSNTGYSNISNGQFVTGITDDGDKIIFDNVSVPSAGIYPLTIRYACSSQKENYVNINGGGNDNITFPASATFTNKTYDVNLNQGNNTITIEKHWGWFDVDYITVGGVDNIEPPVANETLKFEAENGIPTGVNTEVEASASNGEYVAGFDSDGDKITVTASLENAGTYQLKIGYRSTSGDKNNDIYLNSTFLGNILFPQSNSFTEVIVGDYYFDAGQNTLDFIKSWVWMDVDYFEVVAASNQNGNTTNNICDRTLQISYDTTADYYVAGIINSDATVLEDNAAEFIGIQQINLDDEFTVEPGARFSATIEECAD